MKYLIDENLPKTLNIWSTEDFIHVTDVKDILSDDGIWKYAIEHNLIIITKDTDFHEKILYGNPPPKVILLKTGNTSVSFLQSYLKRNWKMIEENIQSVKLLIIYKEGIEGIK